MGIASSPYEDVHNQRMIKASRP